MSLFSEVTVTAQNEFKSEEDIAKEAADLFEKKDFVKALPLYSQLLSLHPKDPFYNFTFGVCLLYGDKRDTEKPIRYLKIAASGMDDHPEVHYYLGIAYHINYRFSEAIKEYELFLNKASTSLAKKYDALHMIEMCRNGISLLKTINDLYILERIEVNKKNFYRSYNIKEFSGKFLFKPDEIKSKADRKMDDQGIIFFSDTNQVIYFSSYGDDKRGSKDIYRSFKQTDGSWGVPERLDSMINTSYDEDYPYLCPDGKTLYFCSKGHNSMGGYDIFKSVFDTATDRWSKPENLDFAINTPFDDILFISDSSQKYACFSSLRNSVDDYITVYKVRIDQRPVIKENLDLDALIAEGEPENNEEYKATLTYIKDKARLEVNSTEKSIEDAIAESTIKGSSDGDERVNKLTEEGPDLEEKLESKIKQKIINQQMVDTSYAIIDNYRNDINLIKQQKIKAFYVAKQKKNMAAIRYRQSEQLYSEAAQTTDAEDKTSIEENANDLLDQSKQLEKESEVAEYIGKQLEKQKAYKERELQKIVNYAGDIQKLVSVENSDSSSVLLDNLFTMVNEADTLKDYSQPSSLVNIVDETAMAEAMNYFKNAARLNKEAQDLEEQAIENIENAKTETDQEKRSDILETARQLALLSEVKNNESKIAARQGREKAVEAGDENMQAEAVFNVMDDIEGLAEVSKEELAMIKNPEEIPEPLSSVAIIEQNIQQYKEDAATEQQGINEGTEEELAKQPGEIQLAGLRNREDIIIVVDDLVARLEQEDENIIKSSDSLLLYAKEQEDLAERKSKESNNILTSMQQEVMLDEDIKEKLERDTSLRNEVLEHRRNALAGYELSEHFRSKYNEKRYEVALQESKANDIYALVDEGKIDEANKELDKLISENKEIISDSSVVNKLNVSNTFAVETNRTRKENVLAEANDLIGNALQLKEKADKLKEKAAKKRSVDRKEELLLEAKELENESRDIRNKADENIETAARISAQIAFLEKEMALAERIVSPIVAGEKTGPDSLEISGIDRESLAESISEYRDSDVFADSNIYTSETVAIVQQYGTTSEPVNIAVAENKSEHKEVMAEAPSDTSVPELPMKYKEELADDLVKAQLISRSVDLINTEKYILEQQLAEINDISQRNALNERIIRLQYIADSLGIQAYEMNKSALDELQSSNAGIPEISEAVDEQRLAYKIQEEAYDNFTNVSSLRNEALAATDPERKTEIQERADDLEEIAMYKQLEVFEVFGIGNRNSFYANKIIINRLRVEDEANEKLRVAKDLEEEAQYLYEQALYYRFKSKQEDLPYEQKLIFLQEANSLEKMALEKQREAIEIYREAERRAPSDKEILAERIMPLNILQADEEGMTAIRNRMEGVALAIADEVVHKVNEETGETLVSAETGETSVNEEGGVTEEAVEEEPNRDLVELVIDRPEEYTGYYSDAYPIPVNPDIPVGLVFKVQIAAFRNPIPQNTFDGISPLSAEQSPNSAFTRYMAGLFNDINDARGSRDQLRQIGYTDAFVVAYLNGQRISLAQARELISRGDTQVSSAKGDFQISPELQITASSATATATATATPASPPERINGATEYYSVQIGVFSKPVTAGQLKNVLPIWYDRMRNGYWRYISGVYASREEAAFARDLIRNKGITDAFVVSYDDERRRAFSRLTSVNQKMIQQQSEQVAAVESSEEDKVKNINSVGVNPGDVRFMVQIAAFRQDRPLGMIDMYFRSLNIVISKHTNNEGMTIYTAGSFNDYMSAEQYRDELVGKGIKDAFVVAYSDGSRIDVQKALRIINQNEL